MLLRLVTLLLFSVGGSFCDNLLCQLCECATGGVVNCVASGLEVVPKAWTDSSNFTVINFDNNSITFIPAFPENKLNVTKLSFRNNAISKVDNAAFRFVGGLKEIDLSNNHLASDTLKGDVFKGSYSSEGFEPLEVEVLRLSGNGLHTLDPDLFEHLPHLRILSLDSNPLVIIDHPTLIALANIPWLEYLDLSGTQLNDIPPSMLHTSKYLRYLNLSDNLFKEIPIGIGTAHQLQCLIMNGNPIEEISSAPLLPSLQRLELSSMPKLKKISSRSLGSFTHLKELVIVNNTHLYHISDDALVYEDNSRIKYWPQITKLNISDNKLGRINSEFLADWDKIETFGIGKNPWVCDCQNQWILSELIPKIHKIQPEEAERLICHDPIEMRGMSMLQLSGSGAEMRCLDLYGNRPENDARTLVFLFVGMLLCLPVIVGILFYYKRNYGKPFVGRCSYQRAGSLETIYQHT